jgi:hypothetical protein
MRPEQRSLVGDTGAVAVVIQGIHEGTDIAVVIDQWGKKREIRADLLPGKGRAPAAGEKWIINKVLGQWSFVAYDGPPDPVPEITGSRADPATLAKLLAALDRAGVIKDSTTV